MDIAAFVELISTLGFPIACVIALAYFAFYIYKKQAEQGKEREDKLYKEIADCHQINSKAIETIAMYAEKLDIIQDDVKDIKTEMTKITSKL